MQPANHSWNLSRRTAMQFVVLLGDRRRRLRHGQGVRRLLLRGSADVQYRQRTDLPTVRIPLTAHVPGGPDSLAFREHILLDDSQLLTPWHRVSPRPVVASRTGHSPPGLPLPEPFSCPGSLPAGTAPVPGRARELHPTSRPGLPASQRLVGSRSPGRTLVAHYQENTRCR
jgi:hypothetical protein